MKSEVYEAFAEIEQEHWWFRGRRKYVRKLIECFVQPDEGDVFCEVGCGTGGNLALLASYAPVDAVEMEALGRQNARAKNVSGVRSIQAGFLPDGLPVKGPYKAVFSLDVVEHVEDDSAAVRALGELVAREKGVLILTVPAYQWMWSYHDEINHHFRRYSLGGLKRVVEQAGLEVIYSSYFNTILSPLAIVARCMDKLFAKFRRSSSSTGMAMPSAWSNRLLASVFGLESWWAGRVRQPFGLSVVLVARRPACCSEHLETKGQL